MQLLQTLFAHERCLPDKKSEKEKKEEEECATQGLKEPNVDLDLHTTKRAWLARLA